MSDDRYVLCVNADAPQLTVGSIYNLLLDRGSKVAVRNDMDKVWTYPARHFTPLNPRPHYKERIAHALGAEVEHMLGNEWFKTLGRPSWVAEEYRVVIPNQPNPALLEAERKLEEAQALLKKLKEEGV